MLTPTGSCIGGGTRETAESHSTPKQHLPSLLPKPLAPIKTRAHHSRRNACINITSSSLSCARPTCLADRPLASTMSTERTRAGALKGPGRLSSNAVAVTGRPVWPWPWKSHSDSDTDAPPTAQSTLTEWEVRVVWRGYTPTTRLYTHHDPANLTAPMDGCDPASSQLPTIPRPHLTVQVTDRPATHVSSSL